MKLLFPIFFFAFASSSIAWSAACCGGVVSAPALIMGDEKAQFSSTYSTSEVVVSSVDSRGVWYESGPQRPRVQVFQFEGAHLISDRWQGGMTLPVIQRSSLGQSHSGLGDVSGTLGYEFLPDWDYHPYRPKGTGYFRLTLPTGKAKAESEMGGLDSRGNGFWSMGLGTVLTKIRGNFDFMLNFEAHRSFEKQFSQSQMSGTLSPGWGANWGAGAGYHLKSWRFGASLHWVYEDPIEIRGTFSSPGALERYATSTFSISYFPNDDWSGSVSYSDQTLIGSPLNTSLGKGFALNLQRRWSR